MPQAPEWHTAQRQSWPLKAPFVISRGRKTNAEVICVTVSDGTTSGHGEAVPYARYGETSDSVCQQLDALQATPTRLELLDAMPPGAARNALDCALWDFEAAAQDTSVADLTGCAADTLIGCETAFTLSLDTPDAMATAAAAAKPLALLKLKLGGPDDADRMRAVRNARPDARLIADANESWMPSNSAALLATAADCGFELIEQPLPADMDAALAELQRRLPVCADESFHAGFDVRRCRDLYDAVNIKLDKTGGLTEALVTARAARDAGLQIMVGCMVGTSLAMAPALLLAQSADWVDLDGPLLLAEDRAGGLKFNAGRLAALPTLWGGLGSGL